MSSLHLVPRAVAICQLLGRWRQTCLRWSSATLHWANGTNNIFKYCAIPKEEGIYLSTLNGSKYLDVSASISVLQKENIAYIGLSGPPHPISMDVYNNNASRCHTWHASRYAMSGLCVRRLKENTENLSSWTVSLDWCDRWDVMTCRWSFYLLSSFWWVAD